MEEYFEIQELAKQGAADLEITRRLRLNRHTVGKHSKGMSEPPVGGQRNRRSELVERSEGYLHKRMAQGCTNAVVLLREVKAQGYDREVPSSLYGMYGVPRQPHA